MNLQFSEKGPRRPKTRYTKEQIAELERWFSITPYPERQVQETLAERFNVRTEVIYKWFMNRRCKQKRLDLQHSASFFKATKNDLSIPSSSPESGEERPLVICLESPGEVNQTQPEVKCDEDNTQHSNVLPIDSSTTTREGGGLSGNHPPSSAQPSPGPQRKQPTTDDMPPHVQQDEQQPIEHHSNSLFQPHIKSKSL